MLLSIYNYINKLNIMNFQSLKWMIDSIVQSYKCPECNVWVNDWNIDIIWAAWTTINIDIECPNCWKHSMIKTEVLSINLSNQGISSENLNKIKQSLLEWNWRLISNQKRINDNEIINLNENLRKNWLNVSDLLWGNK